MTDVSFTIDRTAPAFTLTPAGGTSDVLPHELVFAEFGEKVATGTATANGFTPGAFDVIALSTVNGAISGRTVVDGIGRRVTFVPASDLPGNMEFTASLVMNHVFDAAGNSAVPGDAVQFHLVNTQGIPGTKVVGFVYDSAPGTGGANVPLAGAKVTLTNAPGITTTTGVDVAAGDGVAYIAAGSAGLQIVDLTRPRESGHHRARGDRAGGVARLRARWDGHG